MLKFMRAHATSWIIKVIIGVIIVVFVLFYGGQWYEQRQSTVATVGHQRISKGEFDRTYHAVLDDYTKIFGRQLSPDLLKGLDLKKQALDLLIDAAVVNHEAQRIGLRVSEAELIETIRQNPNFQRGGTFNRALYEQIVGSMGLDNEKFQTMIKRDLLNQRMGYLIGDIAVIITEEEIKELYFLENEQINLSFVNVSPSDFIRRVTITQSELEHYYSEHKEEFRTPPRVKVLYVRFSSDAYRTEVTVSPQEVQEYYDMHREQYHKPERVRVRHILIRVGPEAGPDAVEQAKKKAEQVLAEARRDAHGANFAALAQKYSDDRSASEGGDLGYFARGEMGPTLERVVFSLRKGEIGPVVRTRHGFHIVKVEDVQAGETRSLEEVKDEIISQVTQEKVKDLAAIHAEDAAYQAKKKRDLRTYADEKGLQVREAGPFQAGDTLKGLGPRERFTSVAFTLDAGDISSAFQDGEDFFVLQVVDKTPPQIPPLEAVKGRVREALAASLAHGLAQGTAQDLLEKWKKDGGFWDVLRANNLRVEKTGPFKRSSSSPPGIGPLGASAGEVAALTPQDPWPDDIIEMDDAYVVVKLGAVKEVDEKAYALAKAAYQDQLSGRKGRELLQGWLAAQKKEADIEINEELFGQYR